VRVQPRGVRRGEGARGERHRQRAIAQTGAREVLRQLGARGFERLAEPVLERG